MAEIQAQLVARTAQLASANARLSAEADERKRLDKRLAQAQAREAALAEEDMRRAEELKEQTRRHAEELAAAVRFGCFWPPRLSLAAESRHPRTHFSTNWRCTAGSGLRSQPRRLRWPLQWARRPKLPSSALSS